MSSTNPIQSAKDTKDSNNKYGINPIPIFNSLDGIKNGKTGEQRIMSAAQLGMQIMGMMG